MIDDRRISRETALRIIDDLFEPREPGRDPRVRPAVWTSYLRERTGQPGPYLVRPAGADAGTSY